MEHALVSVATGVLSPLLGKLSTLLEKEYSKLQGVRDEIVFLQNELSSMHAFLVKLADMDDLDIQVKEWRNQVRELSYDIEDCIDEFMLRVDHGSEVKKGFFQKSIHKLKTLGARHGIAEKIQKLKARVGDASERRTRYNFDGAISSSSGVVPIDPRLTALYDDVKCLMGIDGPKEEIIKLLTEGEGEQVQKLRVVSIWGFGGLGKTTLANQVYCQLKGQFDCHAFVSVSQKPDLIRLLSKIILEVKGHQSGPAYEVKDAIDELREHLLNKRYFVIIDDLWGESAWSIVRCAFPENKRGSRVITTTRIESLARVCCEYRQEYIYKMRSLSEEDSRRLFFSRIFGSEDACPSYYKEASTEILKKCGGLPLAIITIASFLASQTTNQKVKWEYVQNSLDTMIGANLNWEGMRQILNLSYINLPRCLKTCFLYLGIYPEDYSIRKYDLIGRWIAEGFVSAVQGQDAEDVAESYFNELANRSMIQIEQRNYEMVWRCRVHDMMLDLIMHKCRDENFITIIGDPQDMARSHYKARRLSLQLDYSKHVAIPATINVSQVRSVATFRSSDNIHMLPLSKFKLIQVLILNCVIMPRDTPIDLTGICELFHLRCFKVESKKSKHSPLKLQLPSQIRRLQYLETFEIRTSIVNEADIVIPSDVVYLRRLLHLIIPTCTNVLDRIGNMKSLHTLDWSGKKKISLEHIQDLAELTNLRYLNIHLDGEEGFAYTMEYVDFLCSSLGKLADCNLKHLVLRYWTGNILWDGFNLSPSPRRFQTLVLWGCWFSKVPKWIADLHNLDTLSLTLVVLLKDDVNILAQLPALVDLRLIVREAPEEELVIRGTGFPVLSRFKFVCRRICMLFEEGVMPKLQLLELWFRLRLHLVGTEHLSGLKEIKAVDCESSDKEYNRQTKSALRSAIHMHPNHPIVNFTTGGWHAFL